MKEIEFELAKRYFVTNMDNNRLSLFDSTIRRVVEYLNQNTAPNSPK